MIQGVNREYIFQYTHDIIKYKKILTKYIEEFNITMIAYCVMNNHAHLLIHANNVLDLSKCMQKTNATYAMYYNKQRARCGVVFRNRFQVEPIMSERQLINCINYIHLNPVKAGIVRDCNEYEYSSYRDYEQNRGLCLAEIMTELFGKEYDFSSLINITQHHNFIDSENNISEIDEYINGGINEYCKIKSINLYEIFYNRKILKELVAYLKFECGFKYVTIRNYFGISTGVMDRLK